MRFILNIGLDVNATRTLYAEVVKQILIANEFVLGKSVVVDSTTEPTLVIEVEFHSTPSFFLQFMYQTALDLEQDCIAVYRPLTKGGALIGPDAAKWGKFNPEFFFTLDGERLAQPVAA